MREGNFLLQIHFPRSQRKNMQICVIDSMLSSFKACQNRKPDPSAFSLCSRLLPRILKQVISHFQRMMPRDNGA